MGKESEEERTSGIRFRHPNRNTAKGEEEELAAQDKELNTYKYSYDTLHKPYDIPPPESLEGLSREDFAALANYRADACLTLYLPTHRAGKEVNELQDMTLFKNALQLAQQQLSQMGMPVADIEAMLLPGFSLARNEAFWRGQLNGLGIFIAPRFFKYIRLPYRTEEQHYLNNTFYVSPLLPLLTRKEHFYLLALSKSRATLYEADAWGMQEVPLEEMPRGIDDVVHFEEKDDQNLFRTGGSGAGHGANYHGIGAGKPDEKANISMYLDEVDETLWKELLSTKHIPLLLAGVDYLLPLFRQRSKYRHIANAALTGNYEREPITALFKKARAVMQPYFNERLQKAMDRYYNNSSNGITAMSPADVIPACYYAKTDVLFIQKGAHMWGTFNETDNQLVLHDKEEKGDECLLNAATVKALLNGADVFILEQAQMPAGAAIAAVMRY